MANLQNNTTDFGALKQTIFEITGQRALSIDLVSRDDLRKSFDIKLEDGKVVLFSLLNPSLPPAPIQSEVATVRYLRDYTSIPVPRILAFDLGSSGGPGAYVVYEKPIGPTLESVLPSQSMNEQDAVVAQIARWTAKLLRHRFSGIGSLYPDTQDGYFVGPILSRPFLVDGRARLELNRGPFASAKEYLLACTQREISCAKGLVVQNIAASEPSQYRRDEEACLQQVEQSMTMLSNLIARCKDLDTDDPELAPFSLDIHELGMKNFIVSEQDHAKVIAVTGLDCISTRPLWQCARTPRWLLSSMAEEDDTKVRLSAIFRHVVAGDSDVGRVFVRALDSRDSTRCSVQDLCDYDAFRDGFLLRPTLESISATLPGEEDIEGLSRILDPSTVMGRVARITLMTSGSAGNALSLAFSNLHLGGGKFDDD